MVGSGVAASAPILAAMFVLADGLRATRFPEDFYDWSPCAAARAGCRVVAKYVATNTDE